MSKLADTPGQWLGYSEFTMDEALSIRLRNRGNADVERLLEVIEERYLFAVLRR